MNKDYTIITVCTHWPKEPYYCLEEYFKSLKEESVLVLDANYVNYTGLGSKPKGVYKAIKEGLIESKYVIFSDCFDFVFSRSPKDLFDTYMLHFEQFPLMISSEKNCFPADLKKEYDSLLYTSPYKYLNSGLIVGETDALMATLEAMDLGNVPEDYRREDGSMCHINDQELYQHIYLKQPVEIKLDYEQILCNTLHSVTLDELEFLDMGFIHNRTTGSMPASFHANGDAKTSGLLKPVLSHLNLL